MTERVTITLKYFNVIASYMGIKVEQRQVDAGTTLQDLVHMLASENESFSKIALDSQGRVSSRIRIFRNDVLAATGAGPIFDGDQIYIFSAVSGG